MVRGRGVESLPQVSNDRRPWRGGGRWHGGVLPPPTVVVVQVPVITAGALTANAYLSPTLGFSEVPCIIAPSNNTAEKARAKRNNNKKT